MDTKSQTDEMSRHRHYRGELSFRRKKDLRCTAHTTISFKFSSYVYVQKKKEKKKKGGYHLQQRRTNELERLQKSDLVTAPNIHTHTSRLHWPWFHKHKPFSTGSSCTKENVEETSYLKIISPRNDDQFSLVTQPFLYPTVQLVSQIH